MKTLITHALRGAGCPGFELGDKLLRAGMAEQVGNQWNEAWVWSAPYLDSLSVDQLQKLYEAVRFSLEGDDAKLLGIIFVTGITHASQ